MKKLIILTLFSLPLQAKLSKQQTAGICCLASAGAIAIIYPDSVEQGAQISHTFLNEHPGTVMLGLTALGIGLCASRQDIDHLNRLIVFTRRLQTLIKDFS